jgi:hypothetical protein
MPAPKSITGINVGAQGAFEADPVPVGTSFPSGTVNTWTADDPTIGLAPADPTDSSEADVIVSVPSSYTGSGFNLSVLTQMPADASGTLPAALTATVQVPVISQPAPLPTGVTINQMPMAAPAKRK